MSITYGTALVSTQLSGTASYTLGGSTIAVPGTFAYTSAAGNLLNAGNGQSVAVTFTPLDAADYTTATSSVTVNVAQAMPTVTVTDSGGAVTGNPFPATGTVTGVGGANLGTPTFTYFAATDVNFTNPLSGAPAPWAGTLSLVHTRRAATMQSEPLSRALRSIPPQDR